MFQDFLFEDNNEEKSEKLINICNKSLKINNTKRKYSTNTKKFISTYNNSQKVRKIERK